MALPMSNRNYNIKREESVESIQTEKTRIIICLKQDIRPTDINIQWTDLISLIDWISDWIIGDKRYHRITTQADYPESDQIRK